MSERGPRLLVVVGPTGSGKSRVAVEVAERIRGEIVSCDALQVYRGLDAGTAKPTAEERRRVPHHLIDCRDPREPWSMAEFVREAERLIAEIDARGAVPLIVGGTGLYVRALLRGILPLPPAETALRERIDAAQRRFGSRRLHRCLRRLDPDSAERIRPGDSQRVQRALELSLTDGPSWSERIAEQGTWSESVERYDTLKVALALGRERLEQRLRERLRRAFEAGWGAEVDRLIADGLPAAANAFKAIGYREILAARRLGLPAASVEEPVFFATRRYAKRQLTWLRREPGLVWLDAESPDPTPRIVDLWAGA